MVSAALNANPSLRDFVILAQNSARIQTGAAVEGGDVGAGASSGPMLSGNVALDVGTGVRIQPEQDLIADSVRLGAGSRVGDIQTSQLVGTGASRGNVTGLGTLPAVPRRTGMTPLGSDVVVAAGRTVDIRPGDHSRVGVATGGKLRLSAGRYELASLDVGTGARLEALGPVQLTVAGSMRTASGSFVGPAPGSSLTAQDVRIAVLGQNGGGGGPNGTLAAVAFGSGTKATAIAVAPNGTLVVGTGATIRGALLGRDIDIGAGARITFEGGYADDGREEAVQAEIGTEGGTLAVPGLTIEIPPDALDATRALELNVRMREGIPVIAVTPDVDFRVPARVRISHRLWLPSAPSYAYRSAGATHHIDDVEIGDTESTFHTPGFSTVSFAYYFVNISLPRGAWNLGSKFSWDKRTDMVTRRTGTRGQNGTYPNSDLCTAVACKSADDCQNISGNLTLADASSIAGTDALAPRPSACGGPRPPGEARKMLPIVREGLRLLANDVHNRFGSNHDLWLNGAYDSSGGHTGSSSLHYSGRAIDLGLCVRQMPTSACVKVIDPPSAKLNQLADMAFVSFRTIAQLSEVEDITLMVFNEWHPNATPRPNHHVHVEISERCPDPWSIWDAPRCRRPRFLVTLDGVAAEAGAVTTSTASGAGAMVCSPVNPATGTRACTEDSDGKEGHVDVTASVAAGSGARFVGWSGRDCAGSGNAPTVRLTRRQDIECTASFDCPGGTTWDPAAMRCVAPSGCSLPLVSCQVGGQACPVCGPGQLFVNDPFGCRCDCDSDRFRCSDGSCLDPAALDCGRDCFDRDACACSPGCPSPVIDSLQCTVMSRVGDDQLLFGELRLLGSGTVREWSGDVRVVFNVSTMTGFRCGADYSFNSSSTVPGPDWNIDWTLSFGPRCNVPLDATVEMQVAVFPLALNGDVAVREVTCN